MRLRTIAIAALSAARLCAQSPAPASFEVASIRPHTAPLRVVGGFNISGTRVSMEGYNVKLLVMEAYDLKSYQVELPEALWPVANIYYDIAARVPGDVAPARSAVRPMLQTLLAERFGVTMRRQMKSMPIFALVQAKGGAKLKASASTEQCDAHIGPPTPTSRIYEDRFVGCEIGTLVGELQNLTSGRPVVDKTGLHGKYDMTLTSTPDFKTRASSDPEDISPFSAVQTLGLKLEAQEAAIEVIVVDHVNAASEN